MIILIELMNAETIELNITERKDKRTYEEKVREEAYEEFVIKKWSALNNISEAFIEMSIDRKLKRKKELVIKDIVERDEAKKKMMKELNR